MKICKFMSGAHSPFPTGVSPLIRWFITVTLFFVLQPSVSFALTPIARTDVVPYQRIEPGETFKFGVIAFSKDGIAKVDFSINGQGYSSGIKTANSMTLNDRTNTWEYWVPISSSEFYSNGSFSVTPTVTGVDGGTRVLTATTMLVDTDGRLARQEAWVDSTAGNDSTGSVGNRSLPFRTVAAAVSAAQAANGGTSDGNIIYLEEGTYSVKGTSASTKNEWIKITKSVTASKEKVVVNSGSIVTGLMRYDNLTLQSVTPGVYLNSASNKLWTSNCRRIGSGRHIANSNPIMYNDTEQKNHFSTNDYTYDADYAYRQAAIVRGATIEVIGNDVFENTPFIVNVTMDDLSNGPKTWHADAYQTHTTGAPPPDNRIIYNYKATNAHYQGIFLRSDAGLATNNAFVNVLIEMRTPADKNELDRVAFMNAMNHSWDHLIMWNCSFLVGSTSASVTLTNSSFVGNLFNQYVDQSVPMGTIGVPRVANGNAGGNEFLYNHFENVYGITSKCTPNPRFVQDSWPCPHWYAKAPDSGASQTYTTGENVVDMTVGSGLGYPIAGSPLIDGVLDGARVPVDADNNVRDAFSDIGALEGTATKNITPQILKIDY